MVLKIEYMNYTQKVDYSFFYTQGKMFFNNKTPSSGDYIVVSHTFQLPSSSKWEVFNKPSIFGRGPMVVKIWDFRLSEKPGKCIL